MITIIFSLILFLFATLVGVILISFFITDGTDPKSIYLCPTIGFTILMILSVNGNTFFPIKRISYLILATVFILFILNIKKCLTTCRRLLVNGIFWGVTLFTTLYDGIPVLFEKGLVSVTRTNNDLIYYLGDMDWLSYHTFFDIPSYTAETPYFYVTNNMYVHNSRLGFDALGSFFMNLFHIESYQIYFALCLACICSLNLLVIYFTDKVLEIRGIYSYYLIILLIFSLNSYILLGFQYGPQILGITCLLGTAMGSILMCNNTSWFYFTALAISGVITSYSEFGYYVFIIYCSIFLAYIVYTRKSGDTKKTFLLFMLTGISSLVLCIPAVIKIINYYIYLLNAGKDSLNADGWIIVHKTEVLSDLLGLSFSPNKDISFSFGLFGLIASFIIIIFMCHFGIQKLRSKIQIEKKLFILVGIVFAIMELAFAAVRFEYGEFKHIISIQPFAYMALAWAMQDNFLHDKQKNKANFIALGVTLFIVLGNIDQINACFPVATYNIYTNDLQELHDEVANLDDNIVILIPDYYDADECHQLIYALKNRNIVSNGNSYFYKEVEKNFSFANAIIIDKSVDTTNAYDDISPLIETNRFAIYSLDYEKTFFENGQLNISLQDDAFKISPDCLRSHNKVYCISNEDGIKVYGPYIPLCEGNYDIECLINVSNSNDCDEKIGYLELFDSSSGVSLAKTDLNKNDQIAKIKNLTLSEDQGRIEIRIYLNANVEAQFWNLTVTKNQ